jgi:hypothetical protein
MIFNKEFDLLISYYDVENNFISNLTIIQGTF